MATRTRYRGYTRPARLDPARIEDSVGVPLDDVDADVQALDDVMATWATGDALPAAARQGRIFRTRAGGIYYDAGTHWITVREEPDITHVVGAVGEPPFEAYWGVYPTMSLRFWRDSTGLVHINGVARRLVDSASSHVFTLPRPYWPRTLTIEPIWGQRTSAPSDVTGSAQVAPNGRVGGDIYFAAGTSAWFNVAFDPTR